MTFYYAVDQCASMPDTTRCRSGVASKKFASESPSDAIPAIYAGENAICPDGKINHGNFVQRSNRVRSEYVSLFLFDDQNADKQMFVITKENTINVKSKKYFSR